VILLTIENISALYQKSTLNNAHKKYNMAIISSYPVSTPQLGDKVLGSNIVDASGAAIIGNPTVQFTITSIKTLVDQNFVQQLYSASALEIALPQNNTGASIKFSATDTGNTLTDNVYYTAATNSFTFRTLGTYYIEQEYNTAGGGGRSPYFAFITKKNSVQVGPTTVNKVWRQVTSDRLAVTIITMIKVVNTNEVYQFWGITGAAGANENGTLIVNTLTNFTNVPSAAVTISKLI